jgi:hypothetical protein
LKHDFQIFQVCLISSPLSDPQVIMFVNGWSTKRFINERTMVLVDTQHGVTGFSEPACGDWALQPWSMVRTIQQWGFNPLT